MAPNTEVAPAAPAEKLVSLFHPGNGFGPLHTAHGVLAPGQSLEVPESLATRLLGAFRHLKLSSSIVPSAMLAPSERAKLEAQIKDLEGKLADQGAEVESRISAATKEIEDKAIEAATEGGKIIQDLRKKLAEATNADVVALQAKVDDLTARLQAFLGAESRKDLDALKLEHKDAVPAPVAA